jgi:hypothetical protein
MRTRLAILLASSAALLASRPAAATPGIPAPAAPQFAARPGEEIVTTIPGLPAGAREFELVLLPDGGAPIQVSPETPAGVRTVRWRMPRTYAGHARLELRSGGEREEWSSEPSAPFALAPMPPAEFARLVAGAAETRAWPERVRSACAALDAASGREEVFRAGAAVRAAEPPPAPALELPSPSGKTIVAAGESRPAPPIRSNQSQAPSFRPLRN